MQRRHKLYAVILHLIVVVGVFLRHVEAPTSDASVQPPQRLNVIRPSQRGGALQPAAIQSGRPLVIRPSTASTMVKNATSVNANANVANAARTGTIAPTAKTTRPRVEQTTTASKPPAAKPAAAEPNNNNHNNNNNNNNNNSNIDVKLIKSLVAASANLLEYHEAISIIQTEDSIFSKWLPVVEVETLLSELQIDDSVATSLHGFADAVEKVTDEWAMEGRIATNQSTGVSKPMKSAWSRPRCVIFAVFAKIFVVEYAAALSEAAEEVPRADGLSADVVAQLRTIHDNIQAVIIHSSQHYADARRLVEETAFYWPRKPSKSIKWLNKELWKKLFCAPFVVKFYVSDSKARVSVTLSSDPAYRYFYTAYRYVQHHALETLHVSPKELPKPTAENSQIVIVYNEPTLRDQNVSDVIYKAVEEVFLPKTEPKNAIAASIISRDVNYKELDARRQEVYNHWSTALYVMRAVYLRATPLYIKPRFAALSGHARHKEAHQMIVRLQAKVREAFAHMARFLNANPKAAILWNLLSGLDAQGDDDAPVGTVPMPIIMQPSSTPSTRRIADLATKFTYPTD